MKNLGKEEDVRNTQSVSSTNDYFLSIPDERTPWYFISLDYADGFVHWCDIGGSTVRVVCSGGLEGKGFAPDSCPICKKVLDFYQLSKILKEEGKEGLANNLKEKANRMRAKIETHFKAIRGNRVVVKDMVSGKREAIADWEASTEDEESSVKAGILSLSKSQFDGLVGLIRGETTPFIKVGDDLGKRVLWTKKESKSGKRGKYSTVVWSAEREESPMPNVEIPEDLIKYNLEEGFKVDTSLQEKVVTYLETKVNVKESEVPEKTVSTKSVPSATLKSKTVQRGTSSLPIADPLEDVPSDFENVEDSQKEFEDDIPF